MLKISKLADYGTSLLLLIAQDSSAVYTAKQLAEESKLALPTVSKILKILAKGKLLVSLRGSQGGYQLAVPAEQINLAQIVRLFDGEIGMTDCQHHRSACEIEAFCATKNNWSVITRAVFSVLQSISLEQMLKPIKTGGITPTPTLPRAVAQGREQSAAASSSLPRLRGRARMGVDL